MTRVALVWLIVGLAVGYLLGTLPGESPVPRTGRATPIEMPLVTEPEPQPGKPKPAPRTVVHKPDPVRAPVRSELAAPAAVGMGTLLVDFSGTKFTNPELIGRTIQGSQNTTTVDRDDNDLGRLRLSHDSLSGRHGKRSPIDLRRGGHGRGFGLATVLDDHTGPDPSGR